MACRGTSGREGREGSGIGRKLRTQEIEPYFVERIKTSSPTSDLLSPQISQLSLPSCHSCVTVTRRPAPDDARRALLQPQRRPSRPALRP